MLGALSFLGRFMPGQLGVLILSMVAAFALGGWAGWSQGRAPLQTHIADLNAGHAAQALLAELASARRLREAQGRSDALSAQLGDQLAANDQLTQEKTHALKTATAGRACLSDRALRLLDGAPGITVASPSRVPAPQPGAAAPGAPVATDTDLAGWIAQAGNRFEVCRQRLDALIAFHAPQSTTATP